MKSFHKSEVVVVGGGIVGCAAAYYLTKEGARVTIIEREGLANQASGYSAGMLNPLTGIGIPGALQKIAMASFQMHLNLWDNLISETGFDFNPSRRPSIDLVFNESDRSSLERVYRTCEDTEGFKAQWLGGSEIKSISSKISTEVIGGLYTWGNGSLDSMLLTRALASSAITSGSNLLETNVIGVVNQYGRITGVSTKEGIIECDEVVFAQGPWSNEIENWLGIRIPVSPLKGQILRTRLINVETYPDYDLSHEGISLYRKSNEMVWIGATEENRRYDITQTVEARNMLLDRASVIVPSINESEIIKHTVCLRPITPDWLPIIGKAPGWTNAWLATGAGKKGILLGPAIGKSISDLITKKSTGIPINGFEPERFQ